VRLILTWETDVSEIDLHVFDNNGSAAGDGERTLPGGGDIYCEGANGYGLHASGYKAGGPAPDAIYAAGLAAHPWTLRSRAGPPRDRLPRRIRARADRVSPLRAAAARWSRRPRRPVDALRVDAQASVRAGSLFRGAGPTALGSLAVANCHPRELAVVHARVPLAAAVSRWSRLAQPPADPAVVALIPRRAAPHDAQGSPSIASPGYQQRTAPCPSQTQAVPFGQSCASRMQSSPPWQVDAASGNPVAVQTSPHAQAVSDSHIALHHRSPSHASPSAHSPPRRQAWWSGRPSTAETIRLAELRSASASRSSRSPLRNTASTSFRSWIRSQGLPRTTSRSASAPASILPAPQARVAPPVPA